MNKDEKAVDSASDERTVNNVMRHEYRVLDDLEKAFMKEVKDKGDDFYSYIHALGNNSQHTEELKIAKQKIQEAVMWAVKHITG